MAHGPFLNALSNPTVSLGLGTVALLGPGRPLIKDGIISLIRQASVVWLISHCCTVLIGNPICAIPFMVLLCTPDRFLRQLAKLEDNVGTVCAGATPT